MRRNRTSKAEPFGQLEMMIFVTLRELNYPPESRPSSAIQTQRRPTFALPGDDSAEELPTSSAATSRLEGQERNWNEPRDHLTFQATVRRP